MSPFVPIDCVDLTTHQIVDKEGRQRFFRGFNVIMKVDPWLPQTDKFDPIMSFCAEDMRLLSSLNLNVVRLNIPWAAVERTKGKYEDDFILRVREIVRACREEGIWVLLDAHQDVYNERFCGDGMPAWSVTKDHDTGDFPKPVDPNLDVPNDIEHMFAPFARPATYTNAKTLPFPDGYDLNSPNWAKFYASDAVTRAFWGFYNNQDHIRDHFVAAWGRVSQLMQGEPNVLGYEILNEPTFSETCSARWIGALLEARELRRNSTEKGPLLSLYDAVVDEIRKADQNTLIFYEPVCGNFGGDFGRVPGAADAAAQKRSVLSWHYYKNAVQPDDWAKVIPLRDEQVEVLGGAGMMTEFDCAWYDNKPGYLYDLQEMFEACDEYKVSWIGWQYKRFFQVAGCPAEGSLVKPDSPQLQVRPEMAKLLSRTYASAVAGTLTSMSHSCETGYFELIYEANGASMTEIKVSTEWHYPGGFDVYIEGDGAYYVIKESKDKKAATVLVSAEKGVVVEVGITRKL